MRIDAIADLDGFVAVLRARIKHANIVAIISVLYFFPFYRDVQFFFSYGLKRIGFRQRYPNAGLAFDLWKFDSIDELEFDPCLLRWLDHLQRDSATARARKNTTRIRSRMGNWEAICKISSLALFATCHSLPSSCRAVSVDLVNRRLGHFHFARLSS